MSDTAPSPRKRPLLRRALRWTAVGVAGVATLVISATAGAILWLHTTHGAEFLRSRVVQATNDALLGRLEIDHLTVAGFLRIEIGGVRIYAPGEAEPTISVKRLVLDARVAKALFGRIEAPSLLIDEPRVRIAPRGDSTNIAMAFAARHPTPSVPSTKPFSLPDLKTHAPSIQIRRGSFQMEGGYPIDVAELNVDATAIGSLDNLAVTLALRTRVNKPIERPVTIDLHGQFFGTSARVDLLSIHLPDSRVTLAGATDFGLTTTALNIGEIAVAADDINDLVPAAKLLGPVGLSGSASIKSKQVKANLGIGLPSGSVVLAASASLGAPGAITDLARYDATLGVSDVNLEETREGLPPTLLKLALRISGTGVPMSGDAAIELDGAGSRYDRLPIEQLHLVAKMKGETAHVDELAIHAAHVDVHVEGTAGMTAGDLALEVSASTLAATRKAVVAGTTIELPTMSGAVHLKSHLAGKYADPAVSLALNSPELMVGENKARALSAQVDMQSLMPVPLGKFSVGIAAVRAGGRDGHDITLVGDINGRNATVDAHGTYGNAPIQLVVRGERLDHKPGEENWTLSQLRAGALGLAVFSPKPSHFAWGRGRIRVSDFVLDGRLGHIAVDADLGWKGPVSGRARIDGLRLENLPAMFIPKDLNLAGAVNLMADLKGTADAPVGAANLTLTGLHYRKLVDADVTAQLHLVENKVEANVTTRLDSGRIELVAHGPFATSLNSLTTTFAHAPIDLTLTTRHLPLEVAPKLVPTLAPMSGTLDGSLALRGTPAKPTLRTHWTLADAAYAPVHELRTDLDATYEDDRWTANVSADTPHGFDVEATAGMALPMADVLRGELRLRQRPIDLDLKLTLLDLRWVKLIGYGPTDLSGTVTGHVTADGTVNAPTVNANLSAANVNVSGYQHLDALVTLATDGDVSLNVSTKLNQAPLLDLYVEAKSAPLRLAQMTPAEMFDVPVQLNARLYRTSMDALLPEAAPQPGDVPPPYQGWLSSELDLAGTANAPEAHLHAALDESRTNGPPVGTVNADLDYRQARTAFAASFPSHGAGSVRADALLDGDFGATALRTQGEQALLTYTGPPEERPPVWKAGVAALLGHPASVSIDADHFNLAVVNGFSRTVRDLKGFLDLHVRKSGPLAPTETDGSLRMGSVLTSLSGRLALSEVHFNLLGQGVFSDVTVKADGAYPSLAVHELSGRSGNGSFKGTLGLDRTAPGEAKGTLALDLKDLPITTDFQTRGFISLKVRATGIGRNGRIDIPEIVLSEGRVTIPGKVPRHLQTMDPHPDFEFADAPPKAPPKSPSAHPWIVTVDKITIPEDLLVEAPLGTTLTLGAHLNLISNPIEATPNNPVQVTGKITIVHGVLSLLRPFEVDSGVITFFPDQLEDPTVDVKAHYAGPDVTVNVVLSGTVQHLRKEFTSSPAMSENEILYYLATGSRQSQSQESDPASLQTQMTDAALSALGAAAIGVVKGAVQSVLPQAINPDVLTVETDIAHAGIGRVRAGKYYFKGRLYVGGQYNPSANPLLNQNTYEGEAQFRINTENFIRLLIGSEGHHTLDYLYQLSFPEPRQKKQGMK